MSVTSEIGQLLDPNQAASEDTEQAARDALNRSLGGAVVGVGGGISEQVGDVFVRAAETGTGDTVDAPGDANYSTQWARYQVDETVQEATGLQGLGEVVRVIFIMLVVGGALYLLGPVLNLFAALLEG